MRLSLSSLLLALVVLLVGAACGGDESGDSGKVRVVTTLPLFADFVREVGGDRVEVTSLVPAGADPHTFEPSPSDVKKVAEADIAFANGLDLEPSAIRLIEANLKEGAPLVKLGDELKNRPLPETHPASAEIKGDNPHLWLSTSYASGYVGLISAALSEVDAASIQTYEIRLFQYQERLFEMETYIRAKLEPIRSKNRKLVSTHDAFEYLMWPNVLQVVAVVAESPGQEPSPGDVADLARAIEDQGVPAVFREPQIDAEGRILEQAAEDAGVQVCTLYSDSLDDKVTSYIEMMRFNADEIARCLGGESGG